MEGEVQLERVEVEYCPTCDVPLCYCKFFKLHSTAAAAAGDLELDAGNEAAEALLAGTAPPKEKPQKKEAEKPKIQITIKQRNKRKNTTTVSMIEQWGIDPKELSKAIGKKMSMGCSTKKKNGMTQIIVQGDGVQIKELLKTQFKIPPASIQITKKIKKDPEPPQPPPQ